MWDHQSYRSLDYYLSQKVCVTVFGWGVEKMWTFAKQARAHEKEDYRVVLSESPNQVFVDLQARISQPLRNRFWPFFCFIYVSHKASNYTKSLEYLLRFWFDGWDFWSHFAAEHLSGSVTWAYTLCCHETVTLCCEKSQLQHFLALL